MWERLRRFSALERPAQELFLRGVVLLPLVALSLRWRGFRATQAALQRFLSKANPGPAAALASKVAAVTAHMVNAADRRVGLRKEKETFEAHAWVERDGTALNEPDEPHHHYAAFDASLSASPPEKT